MPALLHFPTMLRLALPLTLLPAVAFADVTGPARVIDGDTIEVAGERIRLHGIDAPESGQRCRRRGSADGAAGSDNDLAGGLAGQIADRCAWSLFHGE